MVRLAPSVKVVDSGDALSNLRNLVSEILPDMTSSATGRAFIALAGDVEVRPELAHRFDERYFQPRRAVVAGLLQRAVIANQIRPDIDCDLLIDLILGPAVYRWLVTGTPVTRESARRIVDAVVDLAAPRP